MKIIQSTLERCHVHSVVNFSVCSHCLPSSPCATPIMDTDFSTNQKGAQTFFLSLSSPSLVTLNFNCLFTLFCFLHIVTSVMLHRHRTIIPLVSYSNNAHRTLKKKHLRTSHNSLQVVRLASSVLKSIPISFEIWTSEKQGWTSKMTS